MFCTTTASVIVLVCRLKIVRGSLEKVGCYLRNIFKVAASATLVTPKFTAHSASSSAIFSDTFESDSLSDEI